VQGSAGQRSMAARVALRALAVSSAGSGNVVSFPGTRPTGPVNTVRSRGAHPAGRSPAVRGACRRVMVTAGQEDRGPSDRCGPTAVPLRAAGPVTVAPREAVRTSGRPGGFAPAAAERHRAPSRARMVGGRRARVGNRRDLPDAPPAGVPRPASLPSRRPGSVVLRGRARPRQRAEAGAEGGGSTGRAARSRRPSDAAGPPGEGPPGEATPGKPHRGRSHPGKVRGGRAACPFRPAGPEGRRTGCRAPRSDADRPAPHGPGRATGGPQSPDGSW
jgi:hypothetical protein